MYKLGTEEDVLSCAGTNQLMDVLAFRYSGGSISGLPVRHWHGHGPDTLVRHMYSPGFYREDEERRRRRNDV